MNFKYFICLFLILMVIVPVSADPVINPVVQSEPFLCRFILTGWICDLNSGDTSSVQIITNYPVSNNGTLINIWNFTTTYLNSTADTINIYEGGGMNQTPNMTAGPAGPAGADGLMNMTANMTAGPQGEQGEQGEQGIQGEMGPIGPMNQTANMTAGPQGIPTTITDTSTVNLTLAGTNLQADVIPSGIDHGTITGLTDDDHERYFDKDGSKKMTGIIDFGTKSGVDVYLYNNAAVDYKIGFGVDRFGVGNDLSIFAADYELGIGTISFGYRRVTTGVFTRLMYLTGDGILHGVTNPVSAQDAATKNYVDTKQKCGATASVADGGTVTHTFGTTPTYVLTTGTVANNVIDVTAKGSTTFTISIKLGNTGAAGTTQTIYWCVG